MVCVNIVRGGKGDPRGALPESKNGFPTDPHGRNSQKTSFVGSGDSPPTNRDPSEQRSTPVSSKEPGKVFRATTGAAGPGPGPAVVPTANERFLMVIEQAGQ